jgi:hypothetical protein
MDFIHFGCWNNIKGEVNNVMKFLKHYINKNKVDFLNIAGDNYYPQKNIINGIKEKKFNYEDFKIGFELLNDIDIEKNMIFGNHDILDFDNCTSLIKQRKMKNFNIYNDKMHKIIGNTIIFYLDSTIYELYESDIQLINKTCYTHIYPKFNNSKDVIDFQMTYVKNILNNNTYKNIIFTFHHPIFTAYRSKKPTLKIAFLEKLKDFYIELYDYFKDKKVYHLCADTHFYQHSNIEINMKDKNLLIEQYIVGTGGTLLDTIHNEKIKYNNITFTPINSVQSYGFLHVKQLDNNLHFNFIKYNDSFKSKYLKYKKKYLALKHKI